MNNKLSIFAITIMFLILSACSNPLIGEWVVKKYETKTLDQQESVFYNLGTITFNNNGEGIKQLNYSILGVQVNDTLPFSWKATDMFVNIDGANTEFDKIWIPTRSKKNEQIWISTDGSGKIQVLELIKE